ncbi:cysteine-rich CWC family protein [Bacillus sp. FJAT-49736]|uniref:cysteine-rich CWC family protein n=1 Tax=Bacillus sp. FJAT-49736 TaxID=2833582 RepID=UPI001BC9FF7F|nr:cysteine-rich CWC family protein [Bacillus sp. FJAT-49736]MBS4172894.1 cysteine-rich CWC family protein [Bacillus sp. FJAT-49736]
MQDLGICPLCGNGNRCCNSKNSSSSTCWCTVEEFPNEIFELVPEEYLRKTCICKSCLEKFKESAKKIQI